MPNETELYEFLQSKTWDITNQWYDTLDKSERGVYGSTDPEQINELKRQNHDFHVRFFNVLEKEGQGLTADFQDWMMEVSMDEGHLSTSITDIMQEFFRTQELYLNLIQQYVETHKEGLSYEQVSKWNWTVIRMFNELILRFSKQNMEAAEFKLRAQQELITEMSSPVIQLTKETGLLPLVGEISTYRAQVMFEKTLEQSQRNGIQRLFIDLSGVPIVDTMVAFQIFQLIDGLRLIGVQTSLSGIRPEIAQTAVQLGISFKDIDIYSTLASAIRQEQLL